MMVCLNINEKCLMEKLYLLYMLNINIYKSRKIQKTLNIIFEHSIKKVTSSSLTTFPILILFLSLYVPWIFMRTWIFCSIMKLIFTNSLDTFISQATVSSSILCMMKLKKYIICFKYFLFNANVIRKYLIYMFS